MSESILKLRSIRRVYGNKLILNDIDWTLPSRSGITSIVGRSGSGKTSLLNIMGLIDTPDHGLIYLNGNQIQLSNRLEVEKFRRKYFSFVFQNFCIIDNITVIDNVAMPLCYRSFARQDAYRFAGDALKQVGLFDRSFDSPTILSGGEKQRVAIARAIAAQPSIILADEPTGNLDDENTEIIFNIFSNLSAQGMQIVLVTHDLEIAKKCDYKFLMRAGNICEI